MALTASTKIHQHVFSTSCIILLIAISCISMTGCFDIVGWAVGKAVKPHFSCSQRVYFWGPDL